MPSQELGFTGPYPYPINQEETEYLSGPETYEIPETSANTGVIIGQFKDINTGEPLKFHTIYLADILTFVGSDEIGYTLDPEYSPHTTSDSQGRFAIGEALPGKYVIMVWTPFQSTVLIDYKTNQVIVIEIVAGETIDIGIHEVINPMP